MSKIDITISGALVAPRWETLQQVISQTLRLDEPTRDDDGSGRITRISRPDGGCDYRKTGRYEVTFTPYNSGEEVYIDLNVTR